MEGLEQRHILRKCSLYIRNVPVDTKAQFKAYCARRGYTMESAVVALLKKTIREDTPLARARVVEAQT